MDALDRRIINELQGGFPVTAHPWRDVAEQIGCTESELMTRVSCMLDSGLLTRFGPMFHAERMGGALCLCALQVPAQRFDEVNAIVNAMPEVAHNYQRDHSFNMWFVLATDNPERIDTAVVQIEQHTGLPVLRLPKLDEYFVGLRFQV
ncbi:MAG: AsnC family transcriptional regulator [Chromatiales bacterium]|nr:AsnC family transcriptional regulator [Chromatiales bacterium]